MSKTSKKLPNIPNDRYLGILMVLSILFIFSCDQSEHRIRISHGCQKIRTKPRNIILMIGDGMELTQIYASMTVSEQPLVFEEFKNIDFQKTHSRNNY